jgi:hypothetical protein
VTGVVGASGEGAAGVAGADVVMGPEAMIAAGVAPRGRSAASNRWAAERVRA